jgi:HK97 family phage prohead protease
MNKKFTDLKVKQIHDDGKITAAVASTDTRDRDGEVIKAEGWELDTFRKQPRLLWSHSPQELPIGRVDNIGVVGGKLLFDAVFAIKENPFAKKVFDLMKGGFLNTFSVGFLPKDNETQELLEISVVNIPANPEAMSTLAFKEFQVEARAYEKQQSTTVQTLVLSKKQFDTETKARQWVRDHDFKDTKKDENETSYRYRQFNPIRCQEGSFRTIELDKGVSAVICKLKERSANESNINITTIDLAIEAQKAATSALEKVKIELTTPNQKQPKVASRNLPQPKRDKIRTLRIANKAINSLLNDYKHDR